MRIGSLFSGAGGLDMAVEAVFGATTAWHCETDPAASKVLAARWPGVPNLGDITQVDFGSVAVHGVGWDFEPIDILCGGWPCQPFSLAGKRKGIDDERALWPYVEGAIRALRPRIVVLENVPNVLRAGEFDRVAADLAALGYSFTWTCLRASDIGAPHRRERLFILAHAEGHGRHEGWPEPARLERGSDAALSGARPVNLLPTPTSRDGKGTNQRGDDTCLTGALLPAPNAADGQRGQDFARANRDSSGGDDLITFAVKATRDSQWGKYESAIRRWETLTRPAPPPTEPNTKGNPRLSAAFSEWMMGWPAGWVTQVPGISRNDALRCIGNGVIPQQATAALRWLLDISEAA